MLPKDASGPSDDEETGGRQGPAGPGRSRDSGPGETDREYVGAGVIGGVIILLVLGVVLVALIAQNADPVPFKLLWIDAEVALAALLLGFAVAAVVISELVGLIWRRRRRKYRTLREHQS